MCVCLYVFEPLMFFGTNYNSKPRLLKSHIMEGNQSFATMKLLGGILIFKMFSKKGDSEKKKSLWPLPPTYSAQEIPTEKPVLGRQPWLNHLKNLHPDFTQEDPKLLLRYPPHPQPPPIPLFLSKNYL